MLKKQHMRGGSAGRTDPPGHPNPPPMPHKDQVEAGDDMLDDDDDDEEEEEEVEKAIDLPPEEVLVDKATIRRRVGNKTSATLTRVRKQERAMLKAVMLNELTAKNLGLQDAVVRARQQRALLQAAIGDIRCSECGRGYAIPRPDTLPPRPPVEPKTRDRRPRLAVGLLSLL